MSETTAAPTNKTIVFRGRPQRERPMPWNGETITARNKSLKAGSGPAKRVAKQASAILASGAPEGVALATAFKHENELRRRGKVSPNQHKKIASKFGMDGESDVDAATR